MWILHGTKATLWRQKKKKNERQAEKKSQQAGGEEDWRSNPSEVQTGPKASDGIKEKGPGTPNKLRQNRRRGSSLPNTAPPWPLSDRLKDFHKHNPGGLHIDGITAPASLPPPPVVVPFCFLFFFFFFGLVSLSWEEDREDTVR